jgi:hypothetical protein
MSVQSFTSRDFARGLQEFDLQRDGDRLRKIFNEKVTPHAVLNDCMRVIQLVEHVRKTDGSYAPTRMT